jgi:hypothetical protein
MPRITTLDCVAGHVAMAAVRQSPYPCPDNLELVIKRFHEVAIESGKFPMFGGTPMLEFEFAREIEDLLRELLLPIPEVEAWNEPKSGHDAEFVFTSRYDQPAPDDDIIDLDALIRNVARSVSAEEEEENAPQPAAIPAGMPPC